LTAVLKEAGRAGMAGVVVDAVVVVVDAGDDVGTAAEPGIEGAIEADVAAVAPGRSQGFGGDAMAVSFPL